MKLIRITKNERLTSIVFRLLRALWILPNKPSFANHFCPGESGSGEWCHRSGIPSKCGYCDEEI